MTAAARQDVMKGMTMTVAVQSLYTTLTKAPGTSLLTVPVITTMEQSTEQPGQMILFLKMPFHSTVLMTILTAEATTR
jgi:hypothetical protein